MSDTEVFVIRNQLGHYWGKSKTWVDGHEPRAVMRSRYRDEAINTLFELSSRDITLRGEVLAVPLTARDDPQVEPSTVPLPDTDNNADDNADKDAIATAQTSAEGDAVTDAVTAGTDAKPETDGAEPAATEATHS